LATAERVAALPATDAKLRDGALSLEQAAQVSLGAAILVQVLITQLVMGAAVQMRPVAVFAVVMVGSSLAGIAGAIFGIPIAAVLTSIFFYYFQIFGGDRTVRSRAARLVEERESRTVRVPREPQAGVDGEIADPPSP